MQPHGGRNRLGRWRANASKEIEYHQSIIFRLKIQTLSATVCRSLARMDLENNLKSISLLQLFDRKTDLICVLPFKAAHIVIQAVVGSSRKSFQDRIFQ